MSYTIHKSDGQLVTVADNSLDTTYYVDSVPPGTGAGTILVGRNTIDYGASIAQNFLQMTENFASITGTFPSDTKALQGQLWFDKTIRSLYVRVTATTSGGLANWEKIVTVDNSGNAQVDGDLTVTGDTHLEGGLTVDGAITAEGGLHVPVTFTAFPLVPPQVAQNGDLLVVGSVVSIYAGGAWKQIFPPIYS
jgi:hypothetical protein